MNDAVALDIHEFSVLMGEKEEERRRRSLQEHPLHIPLTLQPNHIYSSLFYRILQINKYTMVFVQL